MKKLILTALMTLALFVAPAVRAEETAEPAPEKEQNKADDAEAKTARADVKAATGIENREPTGEATTFPAGTLIYVWSRVFDAKDQSVEHVWKRDGQEFRRAKFHIGSPRWTVNSRMQKAKKGEYVVEVVMGEDKLGEVSFTVE
jgi:hypothetical protein